MAKVRFGDVVKEYKGKIDQKNNPYEFYVAGDHMDTDDLTIRRRGRFATDDVGPAFIREFKKGQVLYGSRRTYLRKIAVADFDGVTANTTFVLETKDESILRQRLLPFIMYTESFTEWSIKKSKGSTNPYVLFKDLADYEFELPDIGKQDELVELLWSMIDTRDAYNNLIVSIDELVKSQFIEVFGDPVENEKEWPVFPLSKIASSRLGKMLDKKKQTGLYQRKYLANANVQWFSFDLNDLNQMDFNEDDQQEFSLVNGDLLVCEGGEIGRCAVWREEINDCYFQKAIHRVRCNTEMILPEYLAHSFFYHSQKNGFADIVSSKATIAHLPGDKLKAMGVIVPPIELQQQFVSFVEQSDKSKFELRKTLAELTAMYKRIIQEKLV